MNFSLTPLSTDERTERWRVLVTAVERLALANSIEGIIAVVRESARAISGADGVTFVLRDDDKCHYVEEDAVGPLWKGRKFPLTACISGWCMLNKQMAVISDIYLDPRIPHDAYRPTFVKSLVMTPVRAEDPLAAIGSYWSQCREFSVDELALIDGLGRSTAAAIAAVQARESLREREQRLRSVQAELAQLGRTTELAQMSSAFAHELTQPLAAANNYLNAATRFLAQPSPPIESVREVIGKVSGQLQRADQIIKGIRNFLGKAETARAPEALGPLIGEAIEIALTNRAHRKAAITVDVPETLPRVLADKVQIQQVLLNLLRNACEALDDKQDARIAIDATVEDGQVVVRVADNGPGLAPEVQERLFMPFTTTKANGMGVGLSICRKIIEAHDGKMWATNEAGAVFGFSLPIAA